MESFISDDEYSRETYKLFETFSEEYETYLADTDSDDELQLILRGHLYIEREITEMLHLMLEKPDVILTNNFMFMNKLNLAVALGLIPIEDRITLSKVNSLRNKFAHNLNYSFNEKNYTEVLDSMQGKLKHLNDSLSIVGDGDDLLFRIRSLIGVIWIYMKMEHLLTPLKLQKKHTEQSTKYLSLELDRKKEKLEFLRNKKQN